MQRLLDRVSALPSVGPDCPWTMSPWDLSTISWVYHEDFDLGIDQEAVDQGARLMLGEVLVRRHKFEWVVQEGPTGALAVVRRTPPEIFVDLNDLWVWWKDPIESADDVPSLGELISAAYERIDVRIRVFEAGGTWGV